MNDILHLLVGTYTSGSSKGIYIYRFNLQSGEAEYINMAEIDNPSYITACKNSKYIYAISENQDKPSYVNAFLYDKNVETLTLINRQLTVGDGPCNISIDCDRNMVLTANYGGGSISVFEVNTYGTIHKASQVIEFQGKGPDPERQEMPHIHCVKFSPDHKYIFASDLGSDKLYRFNVNRSGKPEYIIENSRKEYKISAGSGPRHFLFHPSGEYIYLINELSDTITVFSYNEGNIEQIQTIESNTLKPGGGGDIRISPNGHFLYASNRLQGDGIAIFYIDHLTGILTRVGYQLTGTHPRNICITPNGKFLLAACRDSNMIETYSIDQNSGLLTNIKKDIEIDMPICLKFI